MRRSTVPTNADASSRLRRVACDSLVALNNATTNGNTLFAKNSDRPARECQPLALLPAARHAPGSSVRCQYIEIAQVPATLRVLGSRPFWLWGLEHGVNEAGVAIGNHTVFTRDAPQGQKLIGMDLVRLGLERGDSARAAVDVICDLAERHGQGGSGYHDAEFPYHSSFLVADRTHAFLIETSDTRWALRAIAATGSATNHVTIGRDWDALSADVIAHAVAEGWWREEGGRFDFAAAYRDASWIPPTFSSGRYRRTCELLGAGALDEAALRRALRDHYDGPVYRPTYAPEDERYLSVCMHADPIGATTAGAVVEIPAAGPIRFAACLGAPCTGVFVPLYVGGDLPEELTRGGAAVDDGSPWWKFRRLLELVETDHARFGPIVRREWDHDEKAMMSEAVELERDLVARGAAGHAELTAFMRRSTARVLRRVDEITALLRS